LVGESLGVCRVLKIHPKQAKTKKTQPKAKATLK